MFNRLTIFVCAALLSSGFATAQNSQSSVQPNPLGYHRHVLANYAMFGVDINNPKGFENPERPPAEAPN